MAENRSNRAKDPTESTVRRLFASQNSCAFPDCTAPILLEDEQGNASINVEVAHIVAASPAGPRAVPDLDDEALRGFDNLVLLCGSHHKLVDDHAAEYPVETLQSWKSAAAAERKSGTAELRDEDVAALVSGLALQQDNRGDNNTNIGSITGNVTFGSS